MENVRAISDKLPQSLRRFVERTASVLGRTLVTKLDGEEI